MLAGSCLQGTIRLDYHSPFRKGVCARGGTRTRHERAAEIEPKVPLANIKMECQRWPLSFTIREVWNPVCCHGNKTAGPDKSLSSGLCGLFSIVNTHWRAIYPVDSLIQPLNNQGQSLYCRIFFQRIKHFKHTNWLRYLSSSGTGHLYVIQVANQ